MQVCMWCSVCRQDVPGIAPPSGGICCCARCGGALARNDIPADRSQERVADEPEEPLSPRLIFDSWQLDDDESDMLWLLRPTADVTRAIADPDEQ